MSFSQLSSIFRLKLCGRLTVYRMFTKHLTKSLHRRHLYAFPTTTAVRCRKGPLKGAPSPHFWLNTFSLGLLSLEDSLWKVIEYSSSNCLATACMRNNH